MRTTLRINDDLLRQAPKRASDEGRTLTSVVEEGLALDLTERQGSMRQRVMLPISASSDGVLPGVDLNRSCDLEQVMNEP